MQSRRFVAPGPQDWHVAGDIQSVLLGHLDHTSSLSRSDSYGEDADFVFRIGSKIRMEAGQTPRPEQRGDDKRHDEADERRGDDDPKCQHPPPQRSRTSLLRLSEFQILSTSFLLHTHDLRQTSLELMMGIFGVECHR